MENKRNTKNQPLLLAGKKDTEIIKESVLWG